MHPYRNFVLMILAASVLMFCLMYLNTYQLSHARFSQTRMFMTFIMAGSMALVMLMFMRHMYTDKRANLAIAIERAHISDPRVRTLADGIIEAQRREISEMEVLIDDLDGRRAVGALQ